LLFNPDYGIYKKYDVKGVDGVNLLAGFIKKTFPIFRVIFIIIWLSNLSGTDAYFSIYSIIAFFSFFVILRENCHKSDKVDFLSVILSFLFSMAVFLANYPLFTTIGDPAVIGYSTSIMVNLIKSVLSIAGGSLVAYPIIRWFFQSFPVYSFRAISFERRQHIPFVIFLSIAFISLIHLFLVEYPGNITEDTFSQISEMVSGSYSNFNTYWHTFLFERILTLGYYVFSDVNAALALFCVIQALILAAAFTHALMTMIYSGVPKIIVVVSYVIYAILPYNIALGITVWKDVLFSAGCLLMLSSLYRILRRLPFDSVLNYFSLIFGGLLFILSRTNGWTILLVVFVVSLPVLRRHIKLAFTLASLTFVGWFLLNPALSLLHVSGGDPVESMSVPIQQVSRVIVDGGVLTSEEEELLNAVVDLDEVPNLYVNWLSDPMKVEVRSKDYAYFLDHLGDYAKLWVQLGMRYPWEYVKAWVDQTKGYWNGGYDYPLYSETVTDNPYGVVKSGGGNPVASLFRLYFGLSRHVIFFEPLHSIGLHVWIMILCFLLNLRKGREEWILCLPLLVLVVGLWFGTPVYCSFRYVYPLFVCFPLLVSTSLFPSDN